MTTKTVFGYVNADRTIESGTGDFSVGVKVSAGIYTITFQEEFDVIPAVVANCQEDQTNRGVSIHISQITTGQAQLVVMNTSNQTPYDISFFFVAMGVADD